LYAADFSRRQLASSNCEAIADADSEDKEGQDRSKSLPTEVRLPVVATDHAGHSMRV